MTRAPSVDRLPLFDDLLRDYQRDFNLAVRQAFRGGARAVLGCLPTGMGKTRTVTLLPKEGARVMVIVGADVLGKQTAATIRSLRRRVASIEQAFEKADAGDEWIVATHQTLQMNGRYKRFIGHVDLIVVDECDTFFTVAFRSMMQEFISGGARVLGVTATPYRGDKSSLFGFYETCAYSMELRDAFRLGWLVPPRVMVHRVKGYKFDSLTKTRVDFKPEEIAALLESEAVQHEVCNLIKQYHQKPHGVVRCRSVRQAQQIREMLVSRYGMKVSCVWGTQPEEERESEIKKFESGENTLITNCRVLGRGWDCPMVQEIFNAAPTKNKATFVQGLGRGTRALAGVLDGKNTPEERLAAIAASAKPHWIFHDLTATSRYHQPVTAIEMLLSGPREIVEKIAGEQEEGEEVALEELDAAMAEEIRLAEEQERLAREMEKERRRAAVVGVSFDSHTRDLFAKPDAKTPKVRGWYCPFGKYKGRPLRDPVIELRWLKWALREGNLNAQWTVAFSQEIERREAALARSTEEVVTPW